MVGPTVESGWQYMGNNGRNKHKRVRVAKKMVKRQQNGLQMAERW